MGQHDIIQLLKKVYPKWLVSKEMAKLLPHIGIGSITNSLYKLRMHSMIDWEEFSNNRYMYRYRKGDK